MFTTLLCVPLRSSVSLLTEGRKDTQRTGLGVSPPLFSVSFVSLRFNLERQHIDLERALLTVAGDTEGNKTEKSRHVPLNREARAVLWNWITHREPAGLLFPGRHGERLDNISNGWERLRQEAQLDDFRWHDLRHTFASKLVMAGVDLNAVRELLGHASLDMTLRYAHLAPEHKSAAVAKLDVPITENNVVTFPEKNSQ